MSRQPPKDTIPTPPLFDSRHPLVGRVVEGQFRVLAPLGRGGMGAVYEVEHDGSGHRYALKVLAATVKLGGDLESRFEREAKASSLLQHPNIVEVRAFGRLEEGTPYLVMELARGESVADRIDRGPVPVDRALPLIRQALSGVGYAHAFGMIHRDLKPENLMLVAGPGGLEQVKILDFGLVKLVGELAGEVGDETLTGTGVVFGTPAYMSREQALGRALDGRSDLYTLGVILFEMVTGRPPFEGPDSVTIMRKHVSGKRPTLRDAGLEPRLCTPELEDVIARALAREPKDRFDGAGAMIAAIDAAFRSIESLARE